jgi:hypothetical protein
MKQNNTTLPEDLQEQIKEEAKAYMNSEIKGLVGFEDISPSNIKYAYEAGATQYAPWKVKYEIAANANKHLETKVTDLAMENERLRKALEAKLESKENRDFAYLGPEAEAFLHAVYEGADCWEEELTKAKRLSAKHMLAIRDALVERDIDAAYHECYAYADPTFKHKENPWVDLEALAGKGGETNG